MSPSKPINKEWKEVKHDTDRGKTVTIKEKGEGKDQGENRGEWGSEKDYRQIVAEK